MQNDPLAFQFVAQSDGAIFPFQVQINNMLRSCAYSDSLKFNESFSIYQLHNITAKQI
jgi:hypothetical protein